MYSADCGLVDLHQKYLQLEYFFFADSRTQNTLGRIGGLVSILSYIECPYIHLLIHVRLAIAVP